MRATFFFLALPWLFGAATTASLPALFAGSVFMLASQLPSYEEMEDDDEQD